jgi:cell wall assembly regulator SMI1
MEAGLKSRLTAAVATLEASVPGLALDLGPPASEGDVVAVETAIGYRLPAGLRELYLLHNGQPATSHGLFGGLPLLSLDAALDEWSSWRDPGYDSASDSYSSVPIGAVREKYTDPGWFPFTRDGGGNCLAVDTVPGAAGTAGQVINFGRDEFELFAYAPSVVDFLERIGAMAAAGRGHVSDDPDWASWGIDDEDGGWPDYRDFATGAAESEPLSDDDWFDSLDAEWKLYIGDAGKVAKFAGTTTLYSFEGRNPLPSTTLEPLSRAAGLRELIVYSTRLSSLHDLPACADLRKLRVLTASNAGIDRFPALREYFGGFAGNGAVPAGFLAPLTAAPLLSTLHLDAQPYDLGQLADSPQLKSVSIKLASAEQFGMLASVGKLTELELDASAIAHRIDELDWSAVPKLARLTIRGGRIASLGFVAALSRLRSLQVDQMEPATTSPIDISALAGLPKIREVQLEPGQAEHPFVGAEALVNTPSLEHFSAGFGAFEVLKDLRPDLPFRSMRGRMTEEQDAVWSAWLRRPR